MKILGIGEKNNGCDYHRVFNPIAYMGKTEALLTNVFDHDTLVKGWDIVLYNRCLYQERDKQLIPYTAQEINHFRRIYGFKLVVDIDDYWVLDPYHVMYSAYKAELARTTIENIKIADLVTCTHERLAEKIRPFNPNVVVFPNALPFDEDQFQVAWEPAEKTRFVYCGGMTHKADLELLRGPMKRVHSDKSLRDKIHMVFSGYTDAPEWKDVADRMLHAFTCGLRIPGEIRGVFETTEYMKCYTNTDVSMVPLVDSPFNAMKSNLKVLEAAAAGNACIVSKVNPYLDFPKDSVMYVENQSDWYGYVKAMATFPSIREDYGRKLNEFCKRNFDLRKVCKLRSQVFNNLIHETGKQTIPGNDIPVLGNLQRIREHAGCVSTEPANDATGV